MERVWQALILLLPVLTFVCSVHMLIQANQTVFYQCDMSQVPTQT